MAQIQAHIGRKKYRTELKTATNSLIADEPIADGGEDLGFSPSELLAASLGTCTSVTLRMYADRKEWQLEEVKVNVTFERNRETNTSYFNREIELIGELDEDQRQRLLQIANQCFIHKTLTNPIMVETNLK
jgi:putative redox protein